MHCSQCGSSAVLYDRVRGERICTQCGFVIMERLPEPSFGGEGRPNPRAEGADVTSPVDLTQHDLGLGSKFDVSRGVPPSLRAKLRRLHMWHQRSRVVGWEDRSLREALLELDKLCEDLAISKGIKVETSVRYRQARAKRITAGRDLHQVLGALLFITCRARGLPRTESEIYRAVSRRSTARKKVNLRGFRKMVKLFVRELKIKLPHVTPDDYIDRFASQLQLSRRAVEKAHDLHKSLPWRLVQSKSPIFLAALSLYIAAKSVGEKITLSRVARECGVGISSLSKNAVMVRQLLAEGR